MLQPTQKFRAPGLTLTPRLCVCVAAFTLLAAGPRVAADSERPLASPLPALQETPVRQYRALRLMHAQNDKFKQEAWIECWTELDASGFRYEIVSERGSDYIRDKVLKTLLRREQELIGAGFSGKAELTDANYEFTDGSGGLPGDTERTVLLKPRRRDILLVDGRMVLNPEGTELLRVEGRLARNPSFWTNLVDVVREFARLDGVRVPISTETTAKLKFAGTARMDVRYHYESINGRPVSLAAREVAAAALTR